MERLKSRKIKSISNASNVASSKKEAKIHSSTRKRSKYWSKLVGTRLLLTNKLGLYRVRIAVIINAIVVIAFILRLEPSKFKWSLKSRQSYETRVFASSMLRSPSEIKLDGAADLMNHVGYQRRPQVIGVYDNIMSEAEELPTFLTRRLTYSNIKAPMSSAREQNKLDDSDDYEEKAADPLEDDDCKAQYDWMKTSFPTCNMVHEHDLLNLLINESKRKKPTLELLGSGYWRDTWSLQDYITVVLKTIRYEHDINERNYDRHRRDALAMERLTWSQNIIDIYGYCANSGVYEYAPGGSIEDALWYTEEKPKWNSTDRLVIAYQVAIAIEDAHNSERNGIPSLSHTDITTSQFVLVDSRYKLNDFNRCRFLPVHKRRQKNKLCSFHVGSNPGKFRSPEEYRYEGETEKIDIYSMGNIFYALLTELWPFEEEESKDVRKKIRKGQRPPIPKEFLDSKDPAHQALLHAINECWTHDPKRRPSAKVIAEFLENKL